MVGKAVALGKSQVRVGLMGTGTWAWGDRTTWGYGWGYGLNDIEGAFQASLEAGVNFFDTAEVYGTGRSERFLGQLAKKANREVLIATKFLPYPWRLTRGALVGALRASLHRLGRESVELYQIHRPMPPVSPETWMAGLADAVQAGLAKAVGVSNYGAEWTRRAHDALARFGIPLASNQVRYSLLDRRIERDGTWKACQDLGVTVVAYSPIAQGLLSGKYTVENPPPGLRRGIYGGELLRRLKPLIDVLRRMGEAHGGKTPSQVALNWVICKGALPIPGAKNARQMQENAGALGWQLTEAEVGSLDEASGRAEPKV